MTRHGQTSNMVSYELAGFVDREGEEDSHE